MPNSDWNIELHKAKIKMAEAILKRLRRLGRKLVDGT